MSPIGFGSQRQSDFKALFFIATVQNLLLNLGWITTKSQLGTIKIPLSTIEKLLSGIKLFLSVAYLLRCFIYLFTKIKYLSIVAASRSSSTLAKAIDLSLFLTSFKCFLSLSSTSSWRRCLIACLTRSLRRPTESSESIEFQSPITICKKDFSETIREELFRYNSIGIGNVLKALIEIFLQYYRLS